MLRPSRLARPPLAALGLAALLSGCADKRGLVPFESALARELPRLETRTVRSADGVVELQVEAAEPPELKPYGSDRSIYYLSVPLGKTIVVTCRINRSTMIAAGYLQELLSLHAGTRLAILRDAGMLGDHPFLQVEMRYTTAAGGPNVSYTTNAITVWRYPTVVTCWNDTVGYRATFRRVVEGLVMSLRTEESPDDPQPTYRMVTLLQGRPANGSKPPAPLGFDLSIDAAGATGPVFTTIRAMLLVSMERKVRAIDMVEREIGDGKGQMASLRSSRFVDGATTYAVALERETATRYRLGGQRGGKPIGTFLTAPAPLPDRAALRRLIGTLVRAAERQEISYPAYYVSEKTDTMRTVVIRRRPAAIDGFAFELVESGTSKVNYDERGLLLRRESPQKDGGILASERIFTAGTP